MSVFWGDLVARARGLAGGRLLGRRMEAVEGATDLASLHRILAQAGYSTPEPCTARRVEEALAERSARWTAVLGRWAGRSRRKMLTVCFEEPTVGSLVARVRKIAEGAPPEKIEHLAAELSKDPEREAYGEALGRHAAAVRLDLWAVELALERVFLERAVAGARRGDRPLRQLAAHLVDHRNLWTALMAGPEKGLSPDETRDLFVEGGRRLHRAALAQGPEPTTLAERFEGALARALADRAEIATLQEAARADLLREQRRWLLRRPLSSAGVSVPWLALAAEQRTLRRVAWSLELGVPWRPVEPWKEAA